MRDPCQLPDSCTRRPVIDHPEKNFSPALAPRSAAVCGLSRHYRGWRKLFHLFRYSRMRNALSELKVTFFVNPMPRYGRHSGLRETRQRHAHADFRMEWCGSHAMGGRPPAGKTQ
jgi:hypothetical protein